MLTLLKRTTTQNKQVFINQSNNRPMELFGKVVSPTRSGLNLNGNEELLLNVSSSRITLSASLLNKLNVADKAVGFGYDNDKTLGASAFIYVIENVEEGCKVGKSGTVTSKFHADSLVKSFAEVGTANRFKLDVRTEAPVTHASGTVLYPITFAEILPDLVRTKSKNEESSEEMAMDLNNEEEESQISMEIENVSEEAAFSFDQPELS